MDNDWTEYRAAYYAAEAKKEKWRCWRIGCWFAADPTGQHGLCETHEYREPDNDEEG